jgi:hypothetical protein
MQIPRVKRKKKEKRARVLPWGWFKTREKLLW